MSEQEFDVADYRALSEFRYYLRKFVRFSEQQVRKAGVEPQQYVLMLAVKSAPEGPPPTIGYLAERLHVQHHSAVELIDRLEAQGLVHRRRSVEDRRQVLISLTAKGDRVLRELAGHHRRELQKTGPELVSALQRILSGVPAEPEENAEEFPTAIEVGTLPEEEKKKAG